MKGTNDRTDKHNTTCTNKIETTHTHKENRALTFYPLGMALGGPLGGPLGTALELVPVDVSLGVSLGTALQMVPVDVSLDGLRPWLCCEKRSE